MIMSLMIYAGGPHRDVADEGILGYFKLRAFESRSFHAFGFKRHRAYIGNEIGLPKIFQTFFKPVAGHMEIVLLAGKTFGEVSRTVEDKTRAAQHIHHQWRRGYSDEPGRFPTAVNQAMPGIKRRRKQTPLTPLEHLLFLPVLPDFGGSLPLDDTNHFFIKVSLRLEGSTWRYLAYIHPRDPFTSEAHTS